MPPVLSPHPPPPSRRPLCVDCQRPLPACLCRWVVPTANQVPLLILQHPMEAGEAKGSVRLLQRCLQHCQVEVGHRFETPLLADWLQAPDSPGARQPVLLYPDDAAPTPATPPPDPARCRLVLLDGTWGKTLRLLQDNPLLQTLPRWALPTPPPSRYRVRRAHRPEQRSTLEAACLALGALEGDPTRYAPLMAAFDGWVDSLAARRPADRPPDDRANTQAPASGWSAQSAVIPYAPQERPCTQANTPSCLQTDRPSSWPAAVNR